MAEKSQLKLIPSVEKILEDSRVSGIINPVNRKGVTDTIRSIISEYRKRLLDGSIEVTDREKLIHLIIDDTRRELDSINDLHQKRVINATGVILHTNLGRSPLSDEVRESVDFSAKGYIDLEMDLETGSRSNRGRRAIRLIKLLTGVEDAMVLNNNAAAVMLAVSTLAGEGAVAVSRGEMVEIGGSFRLPEILSAVAGKVMEIGTTNRTHLEDYREAISEGATLLLKVHTSNYRVVGYTNEVGLNELVDLGRESGIPVMYDQGSGILYPLERHGIEGEESIEQIISTGVDLISFSADKVLGGPQSGIIIGSSDLLSEMRRNHLARAIRVGKMTLAALERVLIHYWNNELECIPALTMITQSTHYLRNRAESFASSLREAVGEDIKVEVGWGESSVGGGSFPINPLRTALITISLPAGYSEKLERELRCGDPSIVVRVKKRKVILDLRTVGEDKEGLLLKQISRGIDKVYEGG